MEKNVDIEMKKVQDALISGEVKSVEFFNDGSGASFYYKDPTGNHGLPCMVQASFDMEKTMKIISGFRFKQHELKTCM